MLGRYIRPVYKDCHRISLLRPVLFFCPDFWVLAIGDVNNINPKLLNYKNEYGKEINKVFFSYKKYINRKSCLIKLCE